jgi:hypothetical protein
MLRNGLEPARIPASFSQVQEESVFCSAVHTWQGEVVEEMAPAPVRYGICQGRVPKRGCREADALDRALRGGLGRKLAQQPQRAQLCDSATQRVPCSRTLRCRSWTAQQLWAAFLTKLTRLPPTREDQALVLPASVGVEQLHRHCLRACHEALMRCGNSLRQRLELSFSVPI